MTDWSKYNPKTVAIFRAYDLNENDRLERTELKNTMRDLIRSLEPNMDENKINSITEEVIKIYDLNKNGTIEINEFSNLIDFLVEEKGLDF